jgi:type II secretory pathway component PulF
MPIFSFNALDREGKRFSGQMAALSESNLEEKLIQTGAWLVEAKLHATSESIDTSKAQSQLRSKSVPRRTLIDFCTLMCFQTKVGLPLIQSLEVARQDSENPFFSKILGAMQNHIENGSLSYEAMEKYPNVFSPHFIAVVKAGESSGQLPEAFQNLRDYLEWVDRVLSEVRQASLYPAITFGVVMAFAVGLFIFVIPKFAQLLNSVNAKLPLLTELVFGLSKMLQSTWYVWLLVIPAVIISVLVARRYSKGVAVAIDKAKLRMPIFGSLNLMLAMSRFTHNLAIVYGAGIPLLTGLGLCKGLTGSVIVEDALTSVEEAIKSGSTLSEAMRRQSVFPLLLVRMVVMGETTGSLDKALENVSSYYNEVIPRRIKKIVTIIEPMLTLFLIGLVGCVALAIYLPILALMGTIGK